MITTIRRSGNSYVIRVPREEMERAGVEAGEHVSVEIRSVEIRPKLPPHIQQAVNELKEKPEVAAGLAKLADA